MGWFAGAKAGVDFDFELTEFLFLTRVGIVAGCCASAGFEILGVFEEGEGGDLEDEECGNKDKDEIDDNDEGLVEGLGHDAVKPGAEGAAEVPNGANAGKPEKHQDACDVDCDGDAVILTAEDAHGNIDESDRNEVGGEADAGFDRIMNCIQGGATVTEPSNDEEKRQCNHQHCGDLMPKTAGEFVFDWSLPPARP